MVSAVPHLWRTTLPIVVMALFGSLACSSGCRHEAPQGQSTATGAEPRPPGSTGSKVGNSDPHGVENQPDWEEMAKELRVRVGPRMPPELPSDETVACNQMLDAVVEFYDATERSEARREQRRAELAATREADLRDCVATTSIEAAVCVSILLRDRNSEYPWLLDQCDRAYPRSGTPSPG